MALSEVREWINFVTEFSRFYKREKVIPRLFYDALQRQWKTRMTCSSI